MKVDTVLFDLDGTLVNTNELIVASFLHTLDQYAPGQYSRDDILKWIGEPLRDSLSRVDPERADEMMAIYRKHNNENHDRLVEEYAGIFETIQTLHTRGFKLGVVTSKYLHMAEKGLKLARLRPFFPVVVGLDDISKPKPDAEPVNRALTLLDASAGKALMVGDSPSDIAAGKNAGTSTAGVGWTVHGKKALQAAGPDIWLDAMQDLLDVLGVKVT